MTREARAGTPELRTLAIALIASLLLWNLPFGGVAVYPFKLLATWLHELSHALAMTVTGAGVERVEIYRDTSGLAYSTFRLDAPGTAFIAAAGYMGTPLWGGVLLVITPTARAARAALLVLAALMIVTAALVVAPTDDGFGPWMIGCIGAAIAVAAIALPARWRVLFAHFIAAQACVDALLDIRVLLRPLQVVNGQIAGGSDAHNMAMATFGTAAPWAVWVWAGVWLAWSIAVLFAAIRFNEWRARTTAARSASPTE